LIDIVIKISLIDNKLDWNNLNVKEDISYIVK